MSVTNGYDTVLRRTGTAALGGGVLNTAVYGYDNASRLVSVADGNNNSAAYTDASVNASVSSQFLKWLTAGAPCGSLRPMPRQLRREFAGAIYHVMSRTHTQTQVSVLNGAYIRRKTLIDKRLCTSMSPRWGFNPLDPWVLQGFRAYGAGTPS